MVRLLEKLTLGSINDDVSALIGSSNLFWKVCPVKKKAFQEKEERGF